VSDAPQRTVARAQKARWPGWIWAVPLAAVAIVIWLMVRELSAGGVSVRIRFDDAAGMKAGSTRVTYRGVVIGKVTKIALAGDGSHVEATLRIHDDASGLLRTGTRFYLATVSLSDPASLRAILAGPTIEMVPGAGAPSRSFDGIAGAAPARLAVAILFRAHFHDAGGDLKPGAAVTLAGKTVGEVTAVELDVDPTAGTMQTAVQLAIDPTRFHVTGGTPADWRSFLNAAMRTLVDHQLRARLTQSPPLIGARQIELAQIADAPPARLTMSDGLAEIPSVESSGIDHLVTAAGQFPLREIGDNLRATTEDIKALASSPQLAESLVHLDHALAKVAPTLQSVQDTVASLQVTAEELDRTARAARMLLGTDPAAPDGSIEPTLLHISEAARAIRSLANDLDAHPESVIKGRSR
jgi:paraquat-inducible protein B